MNTCPGIGPPLDLPPRHEPSDLELLLDYLDGALDAAGRRWFRQRLHSSIDFRNAVLDLEAARRKIAAVTPPLRRVA
jgi:hypothetical protein